MKRIIDGVTYNVSTSTPVARADREDDSGRAIEEVLYQTQLGAFFLRRIVTWAVRRFDGSTGGYEWEERKKDEIEPKTSEEAQRWTLTGDVMVLNEVFPEPPEAEAESTVSATIYLRVPETLKRSIEGRAAASGRSVNVWAMRCLEGCAGALNAGTGQGGAGQWKVAETQPVIFGVGGKQGYGFNITDGRGAPLVTVAYASNNEAQEWEAVMRGLIENAIGITSYKPI